MSLALASDVAAAHVAAFGRGQPGGRYILADGFATIRELCGAAVEAAGRVGRRAPARAAKGVLAVAGEGVSRVIRRPR